MIDILIAWENSWYWPVIGNVAIFIIGAIAEIMLLKRHLPDIFKGGKK